MNKALLYLLLFSYTTIICKPILPSFSDCIAHIFWYAEHMATVHYEHGKYHVHYEQANEAKKGYPEKDANLPKTEVSVSEHMIAAEQYDFTLAAVITPTHYLLTAAYIPHAHLHTDFPPPKSPVFSLI
jgi:hypothetical protein